MREITLDYLDDDECQAIIDGAMLVLDKIGCEIGSEHARELLAGVGCSVDGARVRIPRNVIEAALDSAPDTVKVYDQDGKEDLVLNARTGGHYVVSGVMNLARLDGATGEKHMTTQQDAAEAGMVIDVLSQIDVASGLCFVSDCDPSVANIHELQALLETTRKPKIIMNETLEELNAEIDLCAAAVGGMDALLDKPFIIAGATPIPPLTHPNDVLERAMRMWELDVPTPYIISPMTGVSSPASIAGACTMALADVMVGLVLSQAVNPGCSFIGSCFVDFMDMKTMGFTFATPEFMLAATAAGSLYRRLNLPYAVHLGCTDSPVFDQQAAADIALQLGIGILTGASLIYFAGYLETAMSSSLEALVYCDEVLGMLRSFKAGFPVDAESLAMDTIEEVGPGGSFITTEHTLTHYHDFWEPTNFVRQDFDTWKAMGGKDFNARANDLVNRIIAAGSQHPLPDDVKARVDAAVAAAEAR